MEVHCAATAAVFLTAAASALAGGEGATFFGFPGFGSAAGVSDNGRVIISHNFGYQWTLGTGLTPLTNGTTAFQRISANGQFAAGTASFPYRYTIPNGPLLQIPHSPGAEPGSLGGISADGSVLAGSEGTTNGLRAWRWTQATGTVQINTPTIARGLDLSRDGQTIVGETANHPFLYSTSGGVQNFPSFQGFEVSEFQRISAGGFAVVGDGYSMPNGVRIGSAFRWTPSGGYQDLGSIGTGPNPANQAYTALACNADATLIGGTQGSQRAWIWDPTHGMRDLAAVLTGDYGIDLTNWRLNTVRDISADGRYIVGHGGYFNGQGYTTSPFIVMLPAPAATLPLAAGFAISLRRRRRAV